MNNPEYVKVDGKKYKINTDFRVALDCNKIAEDESIGDYERAMAIIYKLFGEEAFSCQNQNLLIKLGLKYLLLGKDENEPDFNSHKNYELDFEKCEGLIRSSFRFDYNYDPYELEYKHFYDYYNDLSNLSSSEFGTCCALNRVIGILDMDTSKLKGKDAKKIRDAQVELKKMYCRKKKNKMSDKQQKSAVELYKSIGLWKGGN